MTWYADYLKSSHWKATREWALDRAGHHCQICPSADGLEVHHRTYARVGKELPTDLAVLCGDCHEHFHSAMEPIPAVVPAGSSSNKAGKWNVMRNRYRSPQ